MANIKLRTDVCSEALQKLANFATREVFSKGLTRYESCAVSSRLAGITCGVIKKALDIKQQDMFSNHLAFFFEGYSQVTGDDVSVEVMQEKP